MVLAQIENPFLEIVRPQAIGSRYDIRVDAAMVEQRLTKDRPATDEMFLEAVGWFDPPLLDEEMLFLVARELNPAAKRSGRPRTLKTSLTDVAQNVESLERSDLPEGFRAALVTRIRNRKRYTEFERSVPFFKESAKRKRGALIAYLYREFQTRIGPETTYIHFEPFGLISVSYSDQPPAQRAMELVREVLDERLLMDPPARRRLENIVSEYSAHSS